MRIFSVLKNSLLLFTLVLFSYHTQAQTSINDPSLQKVTGRKIAPPSPEAASLGKFGDIPVGNYTGVPAISVPIFSFKVFGNDFPISLQYHSGGIKVEEVASNVGLGWTLSVGGVVGCTTQGLEDFVSNGYVRNGQHVNSSFNPVPTDVEAYQTAKQYLSGELDGEPDLFFYSFPGHSGKFVYDQQGNPHLIPNNTKISIQKLTNGFKIIDEQGTIYNFNDPELSSTLTTDCPDPNINARPIPPNTSYYLSSIVYKNQEVINLTYESYGYVVKNNPSEIEYTPYPNNYFCSYTFPSPRMCSSTTSYSAIRIKKITYNDLAVNFNYSTNDRLDLHGSNSLDNIIVQNSKGILNNWSFTTGYFNATTNNGSELLLDKDTNHKLKLLSVRQNDNPPYKFDYFDEGTFPHRLSNARDYWGYYNGLFTSTGSLLPDLYTEIGHLQGKDRNAYEGFAKIGTLKKITYPTGGNTEFEYENNTYYGGERQYLSVNKGVTALASNDPGSPDGRATFTITPKSINIKFFYSQGSSTTQFSTSLIMTGPNNSHHSFTGDSPPGGDIGGSMPPGEYTISASSLDENPAGFLSVSWEEKTDTVIYQNRLGGGIRIKRISNSGDNSNSPATIKKYEYTSLADPTKSSGFVVNPPNFGEKQLYFRMYKEGLNIYFDALNPCAYFVRTASSTVPLGDIQGANVGYEYVTVLNEGPSIEGKSVYKYTKFDDLHNDQYTYPYAPPTSNDWIRGLLLEQVDYKYSDGQYKKLRSISNSYNIYNDHDNFYGYQQNPQVNEANMLGIKVGSFVPEMEANGKMLMAQFYLNYFKYTSAWYNLKSTITKDYSGQDTTYVPTFIKDYYYDNPLHLQLTRSVVKNSDGVIRTTLTSYPDDYLSGTTFLDDLKASHTSNLPIEQVTFINNDENAKIVSGLINQYKPGGVGLIDKVLNLEASNPIALSNFKFSNRLRGQLPYVNSAQLFSQDSNYKIRLNYNSYDNHGNPLMITPSSGIPTSYQWGYDSMFPVAQVVGAADHSFYYDSFEETLGNSSPGDAKTGTYSYLIPNAGSYSKTVNNLTNGKYVLTYFLKSGNTWILQNDLVDVTANTYTINILGGNQIDEIRLYPAEAQMTTYTYDPWIGVTSITDSKSQTQHYEYDALQRLKNIKDHNGNIIKSITYNYKN